MIFADLTFLYFFLPINIILYFSSKNLNYRNLTLIIFSLFFYAWGEPVWITLLVFSATIDYFHGLLVEKYRGKIGAKLAVASSLILNLGLLGVFKYSGFIVSNINALGFNLPVPSFSLPIGISFYTFQTISYVIDVYREEVKPQKSYLKFLMYVSLYPQLVAGPIVRYSQVATETDFRQSKIEDISAGITKFVCGLTKKVAVANTAGLLAKGFMEGDFSSLSVAGSWLGILMYTLQIYYDFSGYSDMAIGLGRIFGFYYPENFNYPYISSSATEFWRRWHITLGGFFRDYLYIPLGGNRNHMYRNLFIVWFLTGLWHGASWNFIIWGLFWGFLICLEKMFLLKFLEKIPIIFTKIYSLGSIMIGWVIFYFTDISKAFAYLKIMFGLSGNPLDDMATNITFTNNVLWIVLAIAFCCPIVPKIKDFVQNNLDEQKQKNIASLVPIFNVIMLIICTSMLSGQSYNPFLYYKF